MMTGMGQRIGQQWHGVRVHGVRVHGVHRGDREARQVEVGAPRALPRGELT